MAAAGSTQFVYQLPQVGMFRLLCRRRISGSENDLDDLWVDSNLLSVELCIDWAVPSATGALKYAGFRGCLAGASVMTGILAARVDKPHTNAGWFPGTPSTKTLCSFSTYSIDRMVISVVVVVAITCERSHPGRSTDIANINQQMEPKMEKYPPAPM